MGHIEEEMETDKGRGASGLLSVKGKDGGRERDLGTEWERHSGLREGGVEPASRDGYVLRKKARRAGALRHS